MRIDIWSDIACPWCAIGRAQLKTAIASYQALPGAPADIAIQWHSFELDPHAQKVIEGDYVQKLADKYRMPRAKATEMIEAMAERGRALGVPFDFDKLSAGNTFDAHRLMHLALEHGVQDELKGALLRGYFSEGARMSDAEALVPLAVSVGLDEAEVRAVLACDRYADAVRADERMAREIGITGVPFFVIDQKYGVSGAQPPDVLVEVFQKAQEAAEAVLPAAGPGCDDGACAIDP